MGSTVWGADVAQLRTLAQTFGKASENLLQQSSQLGQSINSAQAWKGPDAVRFKSEWNSSHRTVLMNAASALKKQSRFLLTQADEQETASNAAHGSGGGPMPGGPGGGPGGNGGHGLPWVPDWLEDKNSPFRKGWSAWSMAKAFPKLRAGLFDLAAMGKVFGANALNPFSSYGRMAWDLMKPQNWPDEALATGLSRAFNSTSDAVSGNWHKLMGMASDSTAFKAFNVATKGLGVLGIGMDGLSAVDKFSHGDVTGGAASTAKAILGGVAVFAPPPANVIAGVITAGWTLYDNVPAVKHVVDGAVSGVVDGAKKVGGALADGAKAVGKFFGF